MSQRTPALHYKIECLYVTFIQMNNEQQWRQTVEYAQKNTTKRPDVKLHVRIATTPHAVIAVKHGF
jgi:hypothetical protein